MTPDTGWTFQQRRQLRHHWQSDSTLWKTAQAVTHDHFHHVSCIVHSDSGTDTLTAFNGDLSNQVKDCIRGESMQASTQGPVPPQGLEQLMSLTTQLKQLHGHSIQTLLRCGPLLANCHKARLVMRAHSKARRQQKRRDLIMRAKTAADANDQYQLFWHIRCICPKTPRKLIRLRDDSGNLLGPEGAIASWLSKLYHADTQTDIRISLAGHYLAF